MKAAIAHYSPAGRRLGFTLVELLVVIGIIAILISMLLPVLNSARRQARFIACASNLRQVAMWGLVYAQDWHGVLPTSFIDANGFQFSDTVSPGTALDGGWHITSTFWTAKAGDIYDSATGKTSRGTYGLYKLDRNGVAYTNNTPLYCPDGAESFPVLRHNGTGGIGSNYALNQYLGGQEVFNTHGTAPLPRVGLLTSKGFWFTEMGVRWISPSWNEFFGVTALGTSGAPSGLFTSWPWPWDYHDIPTLSTHNVGHPNHMANFVFGDCHVEPVSRKQFQAMSSSETGEFLCRYY